MARAVITPTTHSMNSFANCTFSSLLAATEGWTLNISDPTDYAIIGLSTHTSAVLIKFITGSSETTQADYVAKGIGDLSTSIGTSGVGIWIIESARFKTSTGFMIDSTMTGSTAVSFACVQIKPNIL